MSSSCWESLYWGGEKEVREEDLDVMYISFWWRGGWEREWDGWRQRKIRRRSETEGVRLWPQSGTRHLQSCSPDVLHINNLWVHLFQHFSGIAFLLQAMAWSFRWWIFLLVLHEEMASLTSATNYPYSYYRRICYRPHCYHGYHGHHFGYVAAGKWWTCRWRWCHASSWGLSTGGENFKGFVQWNKSVISFDIKLILLFTQKLQNATKRLLFPLKLHVSSNTVNMLYTQYSQCCL